MVLPSFPPILYFFSSFPLPDSTYLLYCLVSTLCRCRQTPCTGASSSSSTSSLRQTPPTAPEVTVQPLTADRCLQPLHAVDQRGGQQNEQGGYPARLEVREYVLQTFLQENNQFYFLLKQTNCTFNKALFRSKVSPSD